MTAPVTPSVGRRLAGRLEQGAVIPRSFIWPGDEESAGTADPSSPDWDGAPRGDKVLVATAGLPVCTADEQQRFTEASCRAGAAGVPGEALDTTGHCSGRPAFHAGRDSE
jgi:hypothetical protein